MSSSSGGSHLRQTAPNRTGANRYEAFRRQREDELAAAKSTLLQKKTNVMTAAAQSAAVSTKKDPLVGENKHRISPIPPQSSSSSSASAASAAFKRPHHPAASSTDQLLSKGYSVMGTAAAAAGATRTANGQTVRKASDPTLSIAAVAGAANAEHFSTQGKKPISSDVQSIRSIESVDEPKSALKAAQMSVTHLEEPKSPKKQDDESRKDAIKAAQQSVGTKPNLQLNTEVSAPGPEIVSPIPRRVSLPGFVLDGIDDDRRPMTLASSRQNLSPPSRASIGDSDLLRPASAAEPRVASSGSRPALLLRRSFDDRPEVKAALKAGLETISPDPLKPPKRSRAESSWPRFLFHRTKSAGAGDSSSSNGNNHNGSAVHPVIRTTMRKEGKRSRFNEDKPWKHNLHTGRVEETERKRYEGLWATNKGIHCKYLAHIEETDDEENNVHGLVVRELWRRSRLPDDILEKIWNLVDRRRIGSLDREEFLVGMWLVDQCLYGRKLPPRVDDKVWSSVSRLNVKINIRKHMHKHIHKHRRHNIS